MKTLPKILLGTLCFGFASLGFGQDIRIGLVADWPMDFDNIGITPDLTGFGNDLTEFNGPTLVPGQRNNAFSFNGSNQYLGLTHGFTDFNLRGLPIYSSPLGYTIAMWVNAVGPGSARYLFIGAITASNNPLLILQTGNSVAGFAGRAVPSPVFGSDEMNTPPSARPTIKDVARLVAACFWIAKQDGMLSIVRCAMTRTY